MALFYPDDLQHNNPNKALVDATQFRGTAYPLNNISSTGSIPEDKRKVGMIVFASSSQEFYGFKGQTTGSWNTPISWSLFSSGNTFIQGGNSFSTTATLGTNDTQNLQLETSGSARLTISSSGAITKGDNTYFIPKTFSAQTSDFSSPLNITPNIDLDLISIVINSLGVTISFQNPSTGWPDGKEFIIRIQNNLVNSSTLQFGTDYRFVGVPSTTSIPANKTAYFGIIYNRTASKWDIIGFSQN